MFLHLVVFKLQLILKQTRLLVLEMFVVYYLIFSSLCILKLDQHRYLPASGWESRGKSKGSRLCLSALLFSTTRSSSEMLLHAGEPGSALTAGPAVGKILGCEWCFGGLNVPLTWLWSERFPEGVQRDTVCQPTYRNDQSLGQSLLFFCVYYCMFTFIIVLFLVFRQYSVNQPFLTEIQMTEITFIQQRYI